jgi:hypothetical protein
MKLMSALRTTRTRRARSNAPVAMCGARFPLAAGLVWLLAGCPASGDEVRLPADQFYFPTGMDIAPDQSALFVASANADLRYDSGAVQVVDLGKVDEVIAEWEVEFSPPLDEDCAVDLMVPFTLVCDESVFINENAGVRTGNFATDLKVQDLGPDKVRLFLAVRGDPSLTWIDYQDENLSCSGSESGFPECDDEHRLVQLRNDEDLIALPDEPFGLYVGGDATGGYVVMTHLRTGAVTVADAPTEEDRQPILSDAINNLFIIDPQSGATGAVGVAGRCAKCGESSPANDRIYVTSRVESRVQTLIAVRGANRLPALVPTEFFFMSRGVAFSTNGRGIAFSSDGSRAYIVNRSPPMLHIFDTSLDEVGVPRNQFLGGVELCVEASNLTVADTPRGERVFVACFRNGQIWSIDPGGRVVDAIIDVGRGPHMLVPSAAGDRLYVSNNLEDTVAVVDLRRGTTENQVILRIGRPGEVE